VSKFPAMVFLSTAFATGEDVLVVLGVVVAAVTEEAMAGRTLVMAIGGSSHANVDAAAGAQHAAVAGLHHVDGG
jgi:hypothetical protein